MKEGYLDGLDRQAISPLFFVRCHISELFPRSSHGSTFQAITDRCRSNGCNVPPDDHRMVRLFPLFPYRRDISDHGVDRTMVKRVCSALKSLANTSISSCALIPLSHPDFLKSSHLTWTNKGTRCLMGRHFEMTWGCHFAQVEAHQADGETSSQAVHRRMPSGMGGPLSVGRRAPNPSKPRSTRER